MEKEIDFYWVKNFATNTMVRCRTLKIARKVARAKRGRSVGIFDYKGGFIEEASFPQIKKLRGGEIEMEKPFYFRVSLANDPNPSEYLTGIYETYKGCEKRVCEILSIPNSEGQSCYIGLESPNQEMEKKIVKATRKGNKIIFDVYERGN